MMMVTRRLLDEGDYEAWKPRFEAQAELRKAAGCRGVQRLRGIANPRELVVIFDWDSEENARKFVGMKLTEKPELLDKREDSDASKLEVVFMEAMEPLAS
jgi:heme-degrading monooxygenase HmoA